MKEHELDATAAAILKAIEPDLREMVARIVEDELRRAFPKMLLETVSRATADELPAAAATTGTREGPGTGGTGGTAGTEGDSGTPVMHHSSDVELDSRGRIVVNETFLRRVAAEYLDAEEQGLHPNKTLQDRYDRSRSAVSHWLKQAREHGFLPTSEGD